MSAICRTTSRALSWSRVQQLAVCGMVLDAIVNDRDYEIFEHELIADRRVHYARAGMKIKDTALLALRRVLDPAAAAALLALAACAAPRPKAPEAPPPPPALDGSYDWHVLLLAPFGSALKDVPATLHEVLLFRDEARSPASADELECYAVDSKAPRFIARAPDQYLLCFKQDRLSRIEATVRLPADEAAKIFADACALWARNGQAAADGCEGQESGVAFLGHLDSEPQGSETAMAVQLDAQASSDPAPDRP